jgi:integrase
MRTRHQDGWVEERGRRTKVWYGHYYVYVQDESGNETRHHRGVNLGEKANLRKWQAVEKLKGIIKAAQQNLPAPSKITFGWYVRERFLPMRSGRWRPSTKATNTNTIEQHIVPALGETPLAEMDKFKCQTFLNSLAEQGYSHSVVDHCRIMVKAILEEAVEADLIGKNTARHLTNPETKEPNKPVLAKDTVRVLLNALPFREKLIAMIAAFCAMRPGEIFGLKRSSYRAGHFYVEGTAWRGTMQPGKAKTKGSKTSIAIPDILLPLLEEWLQSLPQASPDDLLFPSARPGAPLWPHRWLQSHVQPVARSLGITSKINFQILRRTFATNAQAFGSAKDVQAHLRHSHITTTMDVYTQPVADSVRRVVNAVADDVMGTSPVQLQRVQ